MVRPANPPGDRASRAPVPPVSRNPLRPHLAGGGPPPLRPVDRLRALTELGARYRPSRRLISVVAALLLLGLAVMVVVGSGAARRPASARDRADRKLPLTSGSAAAPSHAMGAAAPAPVADATSTTRPGGAVTTAMGVAMGVAMVVHAAGAVAVPGVYLMDTGSRVADVVAAAGGMAADADADVVNLAAPVADGQRVYVPHHGRPVPSVVAPEVAAAAAGTAAEVTGSAAPGPVDLNAATAAQLDLLPGVGPSTAAAIIEHRTQAGRFTSVTQLLDVPGIGEAKLAALRKRVTVTPA